MTAWYPHTTVWEAQHERERRQPETFTPWPAGWRRELYERTIPLFWPRLVDGLPPDRPDGEYSLPRLVRRFERALERFVPTVAPEDQELLLEAVGQPVLEEPKPIEPGCRCRSCQGVAQRDLRATWHEEDRQFQFEGWVSDHLMMVLKAPKDYDPQLGVPPVYTSAKPPPVLPPLYELERGTGIPADWVDFMSFHPHVIVPYRSVLPLAWPLLTRGLYPDGVNPRAFLRRRLEWRIDRVAGHLAYSVLPADVERRILAEAGHLPDADWRCWSDCGLPEPIHAGGDVVSDDCVRREFAHWLAPAIREALGCGFAQGEWLRDIPQVVEYPPEWLPTLRGAA